MEKTLQLLVLIEVLFHCLESVASWYFLMKDGVNLDTS